MRFHPGFVFLCYGVEHVAFQLRGAAHHVLAGNDVQRGVDALRFTFCQAFCHRRGDTLQYHRAHRRGDQVNAGDKVDNVVADTAYRVDASDRFHLLIFTHHMYLVAMTVIQGIQNDLIYIGECQRNARVCQQLADKATTDITCAKM